MKPPLPSALRRIGLCCLPTVLLAIALLVGVPGCKPSPPPAASQDQTQREEPAASAPPDAKHKPDAGDLARFFRSQMSAGPLELVDLRADPPVPLPNAAPGSNAWLYNVRAVFAPTEDVLAEPELRAAQGFASAVDELNALAAWSQAYARSPYAARYPGFAVEPPNPSHPRFLKLMHARGQPYTPLYGKMSAEWQVDHWQYAVQSLQTPTDMENGQPRGEYGDAPVLVEGSMEAARFMGQIKTSLEAAKPKKAALEGSYHADLLAATRPGANYRGQLTHGKNVLPAEARFLAAVPTDDPGTVRMEFRLFHPDYVYLCTVKLAGSPPVSAMDPKGAPTDGSIVFKADLAGAYLRVTDPKFDPISSPTADFRTSAAAPCAESYFWLNVHDHHLTGNMTLYDFKPPFFFSGQEAP